MKKTEFFTAEDTAQLQLSVNTWLSENKNIGIIETGMTTIDNNGKGSINFYILYETVEAAASVAISQQMENIIPETGSMSETSDAQLQ
jgi:hypothetical protein